MTQVEFGVLPADEEEGEFADHEEDHNEAEVAPAGNVQPESESEQLYLMILVRQLDRVEN